MDGVEEFRSATDVSRETLQDLVQYADLLKKWNAAINLISKSTEQHLWTRHFLDSAQIYELADSGQKTWADLGSGAGFPGLIIATLAKRERPDFRLTSVESDKRKAAFQQTVVHALGLPAHVLAKRAESIPAIGAEVVTARAFAPLDELLGYAERHLIDGGVALFPKGAGHAREIRKARKNWKFELDIVPSKTDTQGVILRIGDIRRA